jgi:phage recombination protein Bet
MTDLVAMDSKQLTLEQTDLIKRTIAKGASDDELALFLANCNRTQLDPFSRQIYCVGRYDTKAGREIFQTQISIDGARLVAQRTGEYAGQTPISWTSDGEKWVEVWLDDTNPPKAARVGVYRKGFVEPVWAVATWSQYAATYKKNGQTQLSPMWRKMGPLMLGKCAEMLALRKAFPMELSGLYSTDEMNTEAEPPAIQHQPNIRQPAYNPAPDTTISGLTPPPTIRQPPAALAPPVDVVTGEVLEPAPVPEVDEITELKAGLVEIIGGNIKLRGELTAKFGPASSLTVDQLREAIAWAAGWIESPEPVDEDPLF